MRRYIVGPRQDFLRFLALYLTKNIKYHEFDGYLRQYGMSKEEATDHRKRLTHNRYIVLNVKCALYCVLGNRRIPPLRIRDWSLVQEAAEYLRQHRLTTRLVNEARGNWQLLEEPEQIDLIAQEFWGPLMTYARRFVFHKLAFVCQSNNLEPQDLARDLVTTAIARLYWQIPTSRSPLHLLNALKQGIHNQGVNMIDFYTSQKNGRLINNGDDTFTLLSVSDNQQAADVDHAQLSSGYSDRRAEMRVLIQQVASAVQKLPDGQRLYYFLSLLSGEPCPLFSRWLQSRSLQENDVLIDSVPYEEYRNLASEYMGYSPRQTTFLIQRIQKELAA